MQKALLTGATGFVGGALLRELVRCGWDVRALVRSDSGFRGLDVEPTAFERVQGDIRDRGSVARAVKGCEVVFHVAARYSLWNPRPAEIYRDNVDGTRNVLEAAADAGVSKVVHTSTVGVLRIPLDGALADERSLAEIRRLRGHYKRSKWYAEECARDFASKGLRVVIVNPSTPVGPGDLKPTPTGRMIVDFLKGRMVAYTDTGLNLVAVEDVARGHILAAQKGVAGERYILGAENLSLHRILEILSSMTRIPLPRFFIPHRLLAPLSILAEGLARVSGKPPFIPREAAAMAQRHMYFDTSRARRELGFSPGRVEAALERAVRWFRDNGYLGHGTGAGGLKPVGAGKAETA